MANIDKAGEEEEEEEELPAFDLPRQSSPPGVSVAAYFRTPVQSPLSDFTDSRMYIPLSPSGKSCPPSQHTTLISVASLGLPKLAPSSYDRFSAFMLKYFFTQGDEKSPEEGVSGLVNHQTSCNTSLHSVSSVYASQTSILEGCNQQRYSRSVLLGGSQVSFTHGTPMQHTPESLQEDSLFCRPRQSEQLAKDTVLHTNHTFPPTSERQEEACRGTEKKDNIPKCNSLESQTAKKKICRSIGLKDLQPYFGNSTRLKAANSLSVSVSTLKRVLREHKISRWPHAKINKDNYSPSVLKGTKTRASVQYSLATSFRDAHVQDAPPTQLPTVTVAETSPPEKRIPDANFVTIKARYDGTDTMIKFDLPFLATMDDLEGEVAKRLKLNVGSFTIKYDDQEGDWIAVTGSEDLSYCIVKLGSSATIKMLVQSTMRGPT